MPTTTARSASHDSTKSSWAANAVLCLVVISCAAPSVTAQTTLEVVWGSVPTTSALGAVPRGCSCLSGNSPCTEFDCTCVCDLTAGSCDTNCCCDTECTAAEIARFTAADACLPDGPKESTTTYCTDLSKEALFGSINPKFRMVEVKQDSVVDDLMCVAVDNNPSKGSFFTDDGTGTTALLDAATGISTFETTPRTSTVSTASLYEVSDVVGAAELSGASLVPTGGGQLFVPRTGDSGACVDSSAVLFDIEQTASSCTRVLSGTWAERCASLDATNYITNLRVAKAPNSQVNDASTYVSITVSSAQDKSPTGVLTARGDLVNIASSLQQDRPWCSNAVVEIAYTFTHDGEGHVSAASATLVLGNVTVDGSFTTLQQKFSVAWATAAAVTTSLEAGNVIPRAMSGNPGYIAGKSVLAGVLASDPSGSGKQAINAYVDGLLLNDCAGAMTVPVTFGDSTTFGCTLTLTEAQLETYCTDKTQLANFGFTPTYVGAFGNADPLQTAEWVEVEKSVPAALSTVWQASSRSCSGIAVGLNVEFLTGEVGEVGNPQSKIIAARAQYATDTWTFKSRSSTQKFTIQSTVSFVPKAATDTKEYVPPAPPVLPELPNDLFYPFTLSPASGAGNRLGGVVAGAHVLVAVAVACVLAIVGTSL